MDRLKSTLDNTSALGETLSARLQRELDHWFYSPAHTYRQVFSKDFSASWAALGKHIRQLFTSATWHAQWEQIKAEDLQRWAVFLFWISVAIMFQLYFKARIKCFESRHEDRRWGHRRLVIFLLRRSLFYLGMTLVFGVYSSMVVPLLDIRLMRLVFFTFLMLLLTRWGMDYFRYGSKGVLTPLRAFLSIHIKQLLRLLRLLVLGLLFFAWLAGRDNLLTFLLREFTVIAVFVWTVAFWRRFRRFREEGLAKEIVAPDSRWLGVIRGWSYVVSGGGILLSMAGYKILASFWIAAWIKTVGILFWGWISLMALREWQHDFQRGQSTADDTNSMGVSFQMAWALLQLMLVFWLVVMARGIIWAWDSGDLMVKVQGAVSSTFRIGSLNFSIQGIVLAAFVLFITRLIVNVSRALIRRVIAGRALEPGLKDSISTILGYCLWGLGLLVALATLGVNATSLAVVFGALSVGIGFGLQTIFNNFISGLILLFERPIQVGDTVEINGTWAEVKKINVRATVVQTFDNAAVIIPNSEFISRQVTNWSFKDRRMRRNLDVGVAYGSDINLVEKTLLEIAQDVPSILKHPEPEVLFIDHADSALIFRLRIWVQVEDYWSVPSRARFEIDRRFRALGIEIAFPQRDLHIRSLPAVVPIKSPEEMKN